ncbi:hypothetical protein GCM10011579_034900 [Streptomyces albiflavescens]|uniref:Uncharacterized protein n=1 Tax=Streptomyces albiflavescens TaxID=1623582 RepID=A0A918D4Z0_9ACTN|nr:hypothetical protein GCM10011579_034900 [Streptomyces albiflavescens]
MLSGEQPVEIVRPANQTSVRPPVEVSVADMVTLGLALAAHPDDFPAAVKEYECEMCERTCIAGRQSAHVQEILASPDASRKMLAFFQPG